uniref:Uncharacterized protein n=1 Tax=Gossypium raimondii TaxID=29730 RepID=A0A0D2T3K8_GOSRA|nr:hypothetical protein B456_011G067600 [Gossypium raimondii]
MSSLLLQFLGFPPKPPIFPYFVFPFWSSKNRNVRKCVGGDKLSSTCRETKGPKVVNGLESKIACDSSKVSYALDREVFLFQAKQKLVLDQNN